MEPSKKKNRQSGKCKACLAAGVSNTFLVVRKHERKVTKKCREVQETCTREQPATSATDRNHSRSTGKHSSGVGGKMVKGAERLYGRSTGEGS